MADDHAALLDLENRRLRATETCDAETLLGLLRDDYVQVLPNGEVIDKAGVAVGLGSLPRTVEPKKPQVRVYGDIALMTGPQVHHERIEGETVIVTLFVSQVAQWAGGEWRFVYTHAARLPDSIPSRRLFNPSLSPGFGRGHADERGYG